MTDKYEKVEGMNKVVDLSFEELRNEVINKKAKFYLNANTRWPVEMFRQEIHIGNLGEAEVRDALESGRIFVPKMN
jgi:hypothetical protein